jgi:hypothetical protein
MRTIQVSHDVFAAIWKKQQHGERNEDTILSRLLGVEVAKRPRSSKNGFDKVAYQREYMRERRAKEREARATR